MIMNQLLVLWQATSQTLYMVFVSSAVSLFFGLVLGVSLFLTRAGQLWANRLVHSVLGFWVNVGRSVPFIILLVALIPLTRFLVGTSIGTNAAVVPLIIAAIPFYARIVETALGTVPTGLIEAANAMGATHWQLVRSVLLQESRSSLIKGATLTIIGLVGYSAMAGAIGGGGLGELAINYGYQRFDWVVMLETVIILVVMVQLIQWLGDRLARAHRLKPALVFAVGALLVLGLVSWLQAQVVTPNMLKVGIMSGKQEKIMALAERMAFKRYHVHIQSVLFSDYVLPNIALNSGDIDANIFQHVPYLKAQIKSRGLQLKVLAKTFVYPLGFYSKKIHKLSALASNSLVAIPNDPSNEGRALLLLQQAKLIQLDPKAGLFATPKSIVRNPLGLRFKELDTAQLPRSMTDAALVALTNDFVGPVGLTPNAALLKESKDSPYANVIVIRAHQNIDKALRALVAVMHSPAIVKATHAAYPDGGAVAAFTPT